MYHEDDEDGVNDGYDDIHDDNYDDYIDDNDDVVICKSGQFNVSPRGK